MSHEQAIRPPARNALPIAALAVLSAAHLLVDTVAGSISPLWPTFKSHLRLEDSGDLYIYVVWSISTSVCQLLFGLWSDRFHGRWLIWAGPALAVVCLGMIGFANSPISASLLLMLGGLGIAAFHPEASATAGALYPEQRSRVMAVFALSGYLGQALGPYYSGVVTDRWGLTGLARGILVGGIALSAIMIGLRQVPASAASRDKSPPPLRKIFAGRGYAMTMLLIVGTLRVLPALGVPLALAYLLKANDASNAIVGAVQSAFMAGIGVGGMVCAVWVNHQRERCVLWLFPLLAAAPLAGLMFVDGWTQVSIVALCGLLLGITMPVFISYGQQLLPAGQRVASSITMGVSWGLAGGVTAAAMRVFRMLDALDAIFWFFAACSLASSLFCWGLPRPEKSNDSHDDAA